MRRLRHTVKKCTSRPDCDDQVVTVGCRQPGGTSTSPFSGPIASINERHTARIDRPGTDITPIGATVEWIVEGISADLPVFLPAVTFTGCTAGTRVSTFDLVPWSFTTEIAGSAPGSKLTATTIASDTVAVVQWKGWT
jgi:hypothetical protein